MREAIRLKLIAVPELAGNVYEPHAAGPDTEKPFAVIVQGEDAEDSPWIGFRRIIEVWPYVSQTSYVQVDRLSEKVITALDKELLTTESGAVFSCSYLGTVGPDFHDQEWSAISRGLRFSVVAIQPVNVPETVADDPWLEALGIWSSTVLGQEWDIYRGCWPLGYRRPSAMWRCSDFDVRSVNTAMFEVRKQMVVHILGRTPNEQTAGILQLLERMQTEIKLPLDMANRRFMTVVNPKADMTADPVTRGQISVTLTRRTARPTEEAPLMRMISTKSEVMK